MNRARLPIASQTRNRDRQPTEPPHDQQPHDVAAWGTGGVWETETLIEDAASRGGANASLRQPHPHALSPCRLGVIGCGGFGLFALQHFLQLPEVRLVAMAGTHRHQAIAAAQRFGVEDVISVDRLVSDANVDLVYIATPPFLDHGQAMAALRGGKHVICEKPLAVTLDQADEMLALAQRRGLLLATNLMQRYNPLFDRLDELIQRGVLGAVLHGFFENYAADEGLPPEHWFWDRSKSGGIFIEHGCTSSTSSPVDWEPARSPRLRFRGGPRPLATPRSKTRSNAPFAIGRTHW